jgi:phosphohistidine phosphatase
MKKLILIRHGKSDWNKNFSDQFRPINEKGEKRTALAANELTNILDFNPKYIFSSHATRAKQTAEIVKKIAFPQINISYEKELYTFSHLVLKKWIKNLDFSLDHAIIFGHNPAFTDIAYELGSEFILNIPTSGIVWIEFDTNDWTQIEKGKTKHIILPKELE